MEIIDEKVRAALSDTVNIEQLSTKTKLSVLVELGKIDTVLYCRLTGCSEASFRQKKYRNKKKK